jgi:hypothetical protein
MKFYRSLKGISYKKKRFIFDKLILMPFNMMQGKILRLPTSCMEIDNKQGKIVKKLTLSE